MSRSKTGRPRWSRACTPQQDNSLHSQKHTRRHQHSAAISKALSIPSCTASPHTQPSQTYLHRHLVRRCRQCAQLGGRPSHAAVCVRQNGSCAVACMQRGQAGSARHFSAGPSPIAQTATHILPIAQTATHSSQQITGTHLKYADMPKMVRVNRVAATSRNSRIWLGRGSPCGTLEWWEEAPC